jgi:hypothetical protein
MSPVSPVSVNNVGTRFFQKADLPSNFMWFQVVVRIEELDVFSRRKREPPVSCAIAAAIGTCLEFDAWQKPLQNLSASISRAIVHYNDFNIRVGLL